MKTIPHSPTLPPLSPLSATGFTPFTWLAAGWRAFGASPFTWMGYSLLTVAVPAAAWFIPVAAVNVLVVLTLFGIGMAGLWAGMHAVGTPEKLTWKVLLRPFDSFGQPVATQVVSVLFMALGLLLIVPGLLAVQGLRFAMPLVVIHEVPFWEAMKTSWRITRPLWWKWLAFDLLCLLMLALGALAGGIGLLVALPVVLGARYASFRALVRG